MMSPCSKPLLVLGLKGNWRLVMPEVSQDDARRWPTQRTLQVWNSHVPKVTASTRPQY